MSIKLKNIIEAKKLNLQIVATALYPENNQPVPALRRVLNGQAFLNEVQIEKLSQLSGLTIAELFDYDNIKIDHSPNNISVEIGNVDGLLNLETMHLSVFRDGETIHETVILKAAITVNELIEYIKTISKSF